MANVKTSNTQFQIVSDLKCLSNTSFTAEQETILKTLTFKLKGVVCKYQNIIVSKCIFSLKQISN